MNKSFKNFSRNLIYLVALITPSMSLALNFPLPAKGNDVVGDVRTVTVQTGDTFTVIARVNDVSYTELVEANPGIDEVNPTPGSVLIIPTQYILPDVPRQGIVINLVEMRLYYYPPQSHEVFIFPVGIGREGWESPLGVFGIIERTHLPTWHPPETIRVARAKEGIDIPKTVPPGPDNPLGEYMMRLSNPSFLVHGTNDCSGVGRRSSAGCFRLYPEDIKKLFSMTSKATSVRIINYPYKAGWQNNKLYLEAHLKLDGILAELDENHKSAEDVLNRAIGQRGAAYINWKKANAITKETQAIPQEVGHVAS